MRPNSQSIVKLRASYEGEKARPHEKARILIPRSDDSVFNNLVAVKLLHEAFRCVLHGPGRQVAGVLP